MIHDEIRVHDATVCFYVVSKIRGCGASIKSNPVGPLLTLVDFGIYSSHDQRSLAERNQPTVYLFFRFLISLPAPAALALVFEMDP